MIIMPLVKFARQYFAKDGFAKIYFDRRKKKHPKHLHTRVYKSLFGVLCPVLTENFKVSVWLL